MYLALQPVQRITPRKRFFRRGMGCPGGCGKTLGDASSILSQITAATAPIVQAEATQIAYGNRAARLDLGLTGTGNFNLGGLNSPALWVVGGGLFGLAVLWAAGGRR